MHSDLFSCCLCSLEYNRSDRLPKILPTCGHTICLSCLQLILNHQPQPTCPFDRTSFRSSPLKAADFLTNLALLQILDERTKPNQKLCKQHREPKDMVCLSDRARICRVCSQSRHEGHKVISLKDLKAMVVQKREHLRTLVEDFNNWKEGLDDEFERLRTSSVSEMLQKSLSGLVDENRVRLELDMYFTLSKIELAERLKGDIALKDRIVMQISALSDNIFSDKVMKILKDQNYQFEFQDEASPLRVFLDRFKKTVEELPYYWNSTQNRQSKQVDQDIQVLQSPQETGEDSDFAEETENLKVDRWRNLLRVYSLEGWTCISFKGDSPYDKQDTYILNLETLGNSTRVSLEFNRDMISDDMMKVLEELLDEIYEITDLKVNFSNKNLSPQDFSRVSNSSIWDLNLQQIKSVEIDLEECPIDDNAFVFMLKRLVPNMKDLRSLELRLGETNITDAGLLELGKQMSIGLRSLEHFNLNLYSLRIDDTVISCLFENMDAVLPNLKTFALGLSNTMISEVGVQMLAESVLHRLTSVESLELYLCGIGVRDQEVQGLCAGIQAGGKKIRSLVLNLGNTQVTDHSLGMLLEAIFPSLHGMEVLELYFYNTHVSCDGVQQFCKEINKQESSASRKSLRVEDLNITLSNH